MFLKTCRFISVLCTALVLGLTMAHVLEIPGKRELSGADWLTVQQTFYGGFGIVGGIAEILGLLSIIVILILTRKYPKVFYLTLVTAVSFLCMLLTYLLGNRPINAKISQWTPHTMPNNWDIYRNNWDLSHSLTACLAMIGLVFLLLSILCDNHSVIAHKNSAKKMR